MATITNIEHLVIWQKAIDWAEAFFTSSEMDNLERDDSTKDQPKSAVCSVQVQDGSSGEIRVGLSGTVYFLLKRVSAVWTTNGPLNFLRKNEC
jgi:hypothetical protein